MRSWWLVGGWLVLTHPLAVRAQDSLGIGQSAERLQSASLGVTVGYLLQLPPDYSGRPADPFPLLVFLHGAGERGNGTTELGRLFKFGLPRIIRDGRRFPFVVVSPQLPATEKRWPVKLIDEVIAEARRQYRVDSLRIYLTGLSDGGDAAWTYAMARPEVPAAIVPMAATGSVSGICAMRRVAVWAFHGELDKDVPVGQEAKLVDALNACRPPPPEPARLTVYQGKGHLIWSRTYEGSAGVDIYAWLLAHRREP